MNKKEKQRYILYIIGLSLLLFIALILGFILFYISGDLKATANGYKSDRDICRREYEELTESYEKLEGLYNGEE